MARVITTPQRIVIDRRDDDLADKPYLAMCNCCPWKSLRRYSLGEAKRDAKKHRYVKPGCRELPKEKK